MSNENKPENNEECLFIATFKDEEYKIYSKDIEDKVYYYIYFNNEIVVFYREYNNNYEKADENAQNYCCQLPLELKPTNRKITRASVNSYLQKYMTERCLKNFVEQKMSDELDEKVEIFDLFVFTNTKINILAEDELELYENKFNLYRIIELI